MYLQITMISFYMSLRKLYSDEIFVDKFICLQNALEFKLLLIF